MSLVDQRDLLIEFLETKKLLLLILPSLKFMNDSGSLFVVVDFRKSIWYIKLVKGSQLCSYKFVITFQNLIRVLNLFWVLLLGSQMINQSFDLLIRLFIFITRLIAIVTLWVLYFISLNRLIFFICRILFIGLLLQVFDPKIDQVSIKLLNWRFEMTWLNH